MESPLSFDSTENFRKKLLLKNLKPYKKSNIDEVLEYFEDREDYEKCQILFRVLK